MTARIRPSAHGIDIEVNPQVALDSAWHGAYYYRCLIAEKDWYAL